MTPLKNTDKHFSDYLPPALVKDWRQCFRSRSSVALFMLLELAGWLIFACMVADADKTPTSYLKHLDNMGEMLYILGVCTLCLIIPYRAGSTVAADTRVRSSNFLMLTPLSARRIVWGTWSSTALIVLLAAVLALPLLLARRLMMTAYPHIGMPDMAALDWMGFSLDALLLGWLVVVGWVMAAFCMFSSALPRLLRVLLLIACALVAVETLFPGSAVAELFGAGGSWSFSGCEGEYSLPQWPLLLLNLLNAALLLVLFLELARRHYAAPVENASRSVRLLALLPLLIFGLMVAAEQLLGWHVSTAESQLFFATTYLFIALLSDALLPGYAMPAQACRLWRGLPAWFQKPGFVPAVLCLAGASFVRLLSPLLTPAVVGAEAFMLALYESLNLGFSLMLWLLMTDCFCRRTDAKRPLVFGVAAFACYLATHLIKMPLDASPAWSAVLPSGGGMDYRATAADVQFACVVDGVLFLLLLLLLVFWRGRRKKN